MEGTLRLEGTVAGNSTLPIVKATLTSPRVTFAERDLGTMHLVADMKGRELSTSRASPSGTPTAYLKMTVKEPYRFESAVTLKLPEIRPLLPNHTMTQGMTGSLSGILTRRGRYAQPERGEGERHGGAAHPGARRLPRRQRGRPSC